VRKPKVDMTLAKLRESARKPPKKVTKKTRIGTLNVATGEYKPRWPELITLPPRVYDDLRARIAWLEAAPKNIEPPEEEFERVINRVSDFVDDTRHPGVYVASVQIETSKTKTAHTHVGAFVALLEDDASIDAGSGEYHCYIQRGKRG
jgi:hypothetical protein